MTEPAGSDRNDVSANLLASFRNVASYSSTLVDDVLDAPGSDGRYVGTDGKGILIDILRCLIVLTGSEEGAVEWLFDSRGYTVVTGGDAYVPLESGDIWSLMVMLDWLQILERHRLACPALIDAVFGRAAPGSPPVSGI